MSNPTREVRAPLPGDRPDSHNCLATKRSSQTHSNTIGSLSNVCLGEAATFFGRYRDQRGVYRFVTLRSIQQYVFPPIMFLPEAENLSCFAVG